VMPQCEPTSDVVGDMVKKIKDYKSSMKNGDLKSRSADDLWNLHQLAVSELTRRMEAERTRLENRLRRLSSTVGDGGLTHERRPYPKVLPKYCNPTNQSETWAGRGKQPRWLTAQLRSGKRLSDFLISRRRI